MPNRTPFIKSTLTFLFLTALILMAGCTGARQTASPQVGSEARQQSQTAAQAPLPCGADCPTLLVTQSGQPSKVNLSAQGLMQAPAFALPREQMRAGGWTIDTSLPSPDGKWIAYTSISSESGGPIFLQELSTNRWTNLIQAMNEHLPNDKQPLSQSLGWDVIGWFPDSAQLMIGPTDLSLVVIVNLTTFEAREIPFPGGGRGGRLFVNLAADGSRFLFVGEDAASKEPEGTQVIGTTDLKSGETTQLLAVPYSQGVIYNPRFSPSREQVAYLTQKGQPENGLSYSIDLLIPGRGTSKVLVEGNLGITIPTWSPDGSQIAFTRNQADQPRALAANTQPGAGVTPPAAEDSSLWVISLADGKLTQLTNQPGQVRSPTWAKDGKTLGFVTGDGEVRLARTDRPGETWQVSGPTLRPELTSINFMP